MKSKLKFDLTEGNMPCIRFEISRDKDDLRDLVATRFFEELGYESNTLCVIFECDPNEYHPRYQGIILPVSNILLSPEQMGIEIPTETQIVTGTPVKINKNVSAEG